MKATDLLVNQHRDIEHLFHALERTDEGDKSALRQELAQILVAHDVIERELFYASLDTVAPEIVRTSIEEHTLVEVMLARFLAISPSDATFTAKLSVLRETFKHHAGMEEHDLLPKASNALGDYLDQLGDQMERRFEDVRREGYAKFLGRALVDVVPVAATRGIAKKATRRAPAKRAAAKKSAKRTAPTPKRAPARAAASRGAAGRAKATRKAAAPARRGGATGAKKSSRAA